MQLITKKAIKGETSILQHRKQYNAALTGYTKITETTISEEYRVWSDLHS